MRNRTWYFVILQKMNRRAPSLLAALLLLPLFSCSALGIGGTPLPDVKPPNVRVSSVRVAELPTARDLASYYCAQYLGRLVCRAFGSAPRISDIDFAFDVELELGNSSKVPLPLVQTLFAFTAFPQETGSQNLGAVCMTFCENPSNCKQDANACMSDEPVIRDMRDFANAAPGFLIATALGERKLSDLRVRTVPPNERLKMVVRLGLDPTQMVGLIRQYARGEIDRIKEGRIPELRIPYQIEGTTWVAVESLGRLASSFGPTTGEWQLER